MASSTFLARPARLTLATAALALGAASIAAGAPAAAFGAPGLASDPAPTARHADPGPDPAIEAVIDRDLPGSGSPGVAYAVVADGELTAVGSRGVDEIGTDRALAPDTPFSIGSITKSFTAVAILQLVEEGALELDTPFSRYLPEFEGGAAEAVTIRELLSHTSGYSTLQGNASHLDDREGGDGSDALARAVDALVAVAPASAPGERWEYSNTNYRILGRVIEVVSGESYAEVVTARILEPIGMRDSFVADGAVHDEAATGHLPWFFGRIATPERATELSTAPQGGVYASARDLARYLGVLMNGEDDVLTAADKALMLRPAGAASPFYGLGWFLDDRDGTAWHAGNTPGFESLATMLPSERRGVVVLVNAGSGIGFNETAPLRDDVTAEALGLAAPPDDSRFWQKALFVGLLLLPLLYLGFGVWAWGHRRAIRAKRGAGASGLFSLWFPLVTTGVAAWVLVALVPDLMGAPISTVAVFSPDVALLLIASAALGVAWAGFRLVLAYSGRRAGSA